MTNNMTSNSKPQDQSVQAALQRQLARIKKEEEEELWISGEELYTEGSSDEEEYELRSRRKINNNQSSRTSSSNPNDKGKGHSPVRAQTRAIPENPADTPKNKMSEEPFIVKNTSKSRKMSPASLKLSNSSSAESQHTQFSPSTATSTSNRM